MKKLSINENLIIVIKSLVLTISGIIILELMLSLMRKIGLNILNDSLTGNVLLEITILIMQFLIIRKYSKGELLAAIGLDNAKGSIKNVLQGAALGLIGTILIYLIIFIMEIGFYEGVGFKFYNTKTVLFFVFSIFTRAFFAGVCEEVFFRGVLLNYLVKYKGKIFGLLVSSLIFAVFHCTRYASLYQLASVLISGITLGYIYIRTKSLYMSIGLHFATDFFINLVAPKGETSLFVLVINERFNLDYLTQSIFILMSASYLVLLFIVFLKNKARDKIRIDEEQRG